MKRLRPFLALLTLLPGLSPAQENPPAHTELIVVTGAAGTEQYGDRFKLWSLQWKRAGEQGGASTQIIGPAAGDKERVRKALEAAPKDGSEPLWIALVGHGTWDRKEGKFNLAGDDVSASEFASWLKPFERPVVIAATFAASGAWLQTLSGPNRIVVTSTRSGSEENFSYFGEYFSAALTDAASDIDKDGQVSLLEAWITAASKTAAFYAGEGRLATEHSLLDDNGDGKGTPPDWFQGIRAVKKSKDNAQPDGQRAQQLILVPNPAERGLPVALREKRNALELEIGKLREAKSGMAEEEYYRQLEALLLKIAALYED